MPRTAGALSTVGGSQVERLTEVYNPVAQVFIPPTHVSGGSNTWTVTPGGGYGGVTSMILIFAQSNNITPMLPSSVSDGVNTWVTDSTLSNDSLGGNQSINVWQTTNLAVSLATITITWAHAAEGVVHLYILNNTLNSPIDSSRTFNVNPSLLGPAFVSGTATGGTTTRPQLFIGACWSSWSTPGEVAPTMSSCTFANALTPSNFAPSATAMTSTPLHGTFNGTGIQTASVLVTAAGNQQYSGNNSNNNADGCWAAIIPILHP